MEIPHFLELESVRDAVPDSFKCVKCHKILFHAMIAECGHYVCLECQHELERATSPRCPDCLRRTSWTEDEAFSERTTLFVKDALRQEALDYLEPRFSQFSEEQIWRIILRCSVSEEPQVNLRAAAAELGYSDPSQTALFSTREAEFRFNFGQAVVCASAVALTAIPEPAEVRCLRVEGVWLDDLDCLSAFPNVCELQVSRCRATLSFEKLPFVLPILARLIVEDCAVEAVRGTETCVYLRDIQLTRCRALREVGIPPMNDMRRSARDGYQEGGRIRVRGCPVLASVVLEVSEQMSHLLTFAAPHSKLLSLDGLQLCANLSELDLHDCPLLRSIGAAASLRQLTSIDVSRTMTESIDGLQNCTQLRSVSFAGCGVRGNLSALRHATQLQSLNAAHTKIDSLAGLDACFDLRCVNVDHCARLVDITALTGLVRLTHVNASHTAIRSVSALVSFGSLEEVRLCGCTQLRDLLPWQKVKRARHLRVLLLDDSHITTLADAQTCLAAVEVLSLHRCQKLKDFSHLQRAVALTSLDLTGTAFADSDLRHIAAPRLTSLRLTDTQVRDLSLLRHRESVTELYLGNSAISSLGLVAAFSVSLRVLEVRSSSLKNIDALQTFQALEVVKLTGASVKSIDVLKGCVARLTRLDVTGTSVEDIGALQDATQLTEVVLSNTRVEDITALAASASTLRRLLLRGCRVNSLAAVEAATLLEHVELNDTEVSNLEPLRNSAPSLRVLSAPRCRNITSVDALVEAGQLVHLDLRETRVKDIGPLRKTAPALEAVYLDGCPVADISALAGALRLKKLSLSSTLVSSIAAVEGCVATLQKVWLDNCKNLHDISVLQNAPALTYLNIENTHIKRKPAFSQKVKIRK